MLLMILRCKFCLSFPSSVSRFVCSTNTDLPSSALAKPAASSTAATPLQPIGKQSDDGRVKAIMNRQYNTPAGLYSEKKTTETFSEQSTNLIENLQR